MILGVGIDITQNNRFVSWLEYDKIQLSRVLSKNELNLIIDLNNQHKIEFFASRFAAKEAFLKAFSSALASLKINEQTTQSFDLLFTCKHVDICTGVFDTPKIDVDWQAFETKLEVTIPKIRVDLSFSHEKDYSVAIVVMSL